MLSHECKSSKSKNKRQSVLGVFFDKWMIFFLISIKPPKAEDLC